MRSTLTTHVRRPGRVTALALAVFLALGAMAHAAPSSPTPADAEEARINQVFERFDSSRDGVEGQLRALELQLIEVDKRLAVLRAKLTKAEAELKKRKAQLERTIKELNEQRLLTRDSAAAMYMRGPWSYLNTMLNARDISEMVRVEVYTESVLNDFIRVVHELEGKKAAAERAHAAARSKALDLRRRTNAVEEEETDVLEKQQVHFARRQALINALIADVGGLDELRKRGFDVIVRSFAGSSTRITTLLQEAQVDQDIAKENDVLLRWPVESRRITSRFGWRIHPLWGYRSNHTGIDIGSDYGNEIVASMEGRVLDVASMGPYGLTVVIDHGHSLGTVYAHMSRALVDPGDTVEAGQPIGRIGCTGWCTGPHIHYEVRLATKPVNPIFWL